MRSPLKVVVVAATPLTATRENPHAATKIHHRQKNKMIFLSWFIEIKLLLKTESLTKEARIYNGEKTISLTSGAGKTGQPHVKE